MIANIFGPDLGIVLLIILLVVVFGSQLPKIARNAGMAGREFRKAQREAEEDAERDRLGRPTTTPVSAPPQEAPIKLTSAELDAVLQARQDQVKRDCASPRA